MPSMFNTSLNSLAVNAAYIILSPGMLTTSIYGTPQRPDPERLNPIWESMMSLTQLATSISPAPSDHDRLLG